jgi:hypothetical protein
MGHSRKKTISQKVVGAATTATGVPSPIRKILGNRFIALAIVAIFPALWAMGVVSVEWDGARPRLSFNRQRAEEVRQAAEQEVGELREDIRGETPSHQGLIPQFDRGEAPRFDFSLGQQPDQEPAPRIAERIESFQEGLTQDHAPGLQLSPVFGGQAEAPKHGFHPLSDLKDRLNGNR